MFLILDQLMFQYHTRSSIVLFPIPAVPVTVLKNHLSQLYQLSEKQQAQKMTEGTWIENNIP